jgi:hypothetical protein
LERSNIRIATQSLNKLYKGLRKSISKKNVISAIEILNEAMKKFMLQLRIGT